MGIGTALGMLAFIGVSWLGLRIMVRNRLAGARARVALWAESQGLRVASLEVRWLKRGPFAWRATHQQVVFYATLRDAALGRARKAWICCGDAFLGMASDRLAVAWEDAPVGTTASVGRMP